MGSYITEKIKTWFRARKWSASEASGGLRFRLLSPINSGAGAIHYDNNDSDEYHACYYNESYLVFESNHISGSNQILVSIYERKHYEVRDHSVPNDSMWYSHRISDECSDWKLQGNCYIQAAAILKLADLIKENQKEYNKIDLNNCKNFPSKFLKVDSNYIKLLDVNTTQEEIKYTYSNTRLRKERNTDDAYQWSKNHK